jgi:hypothetical protein
MRWFLIGLATIWVASLAVAAMVFLAMWFSEWRRSPRGGMRAQRGSSVRDGAASRFLTMDPGLLVPWSVVKASKQRLGVDAAIFEAAEEDTSPEPTRHTSDDIQAA